MPKKRVSLMRHMQNAHYSMFNKRVSRDPQQWRYFLETSATVQAKTDKSYDVNALPRAFLLKTE